MKLLTTGISLLFAIACVSQSELTEQPPKKIQVKMYKNIGCMCCDKWAATLEEKGFEVTISPIDTLAELKHNHLIPDEFHGCHTAFIEGYVIEGHVPVEDILSLLEERPEAQGLSVVGMPIGSPGMEVKGREAEPYDVHLFNFDGSSEVFAKH